MREERRPARMAALLDAVQGDHAAPPGQEAWFRAPGRVNLMGDHTDYNEGFALPIAIDRACVAAVRPRSDGRVVAASEQFAGHRAELGANGDDDPATAEPPWARLVAGVVRALARRGRPDTGATVVFSSDVPAGSGLASSAAAAVACALALGHVAGWKPDPLELALACRDAEEEAFGVPCGLMDQTAALVGRAGTAVLLDCRSLGHRHVRLPSGVVVVAVHSGITRALESTAYAERRAACEASARRLGVPALRDAGANDVIDDPIARHVVTENERVHRTAAALEAGDTHLLGELLAASHASLRDDFAVSTPELDALVGALTGAGAIGARPTGAGFGGCVVALVDRARAAAALEAATKTYAAATGLAAAVFECRAADGAGRVYV